MYEMTIYLASYTSAQKTRNSVADALEPRASPYESIWIYTGRISLPVQRGTTIVQGRYSINLRMHRRCNWGKIYIKVWATGGIYCRALFVNPEGVPHVDFGEKLNNYNGNASTIPHKSDFMYTYIGRISRNLKIVRSIDLAELNLSYKQTTEPLLTWATFVTGETVKFMTRSHCIVINESIFGYISTKHV